MVDDGYWFVYEILWFVLCGWYVFVMLFVYLFVILNVVYVMMWF